jgi:tRNA A-37 threonylcarbamoyl transferase component Bud32
MTCPACSGIIPDSAAQCPACGKAADATAAATLTCLHQESAPTLAGAASAPKSWHVFAPGAIIAGRYRVVNLLGQGGMGEVYRADDLTLNQPVAMKFLPPKAASDQAVLARFQNEVRVARTVAHPAVCRVYDIGESEGRIFLTMEYIDGEDLASLLRRIGRLPADKATELGRQICAGVAAAHEAGILHRDLKPANIMVDGRGRAHVADFGVAGLAADLKQDTSRAGTPAYMAPEQLGGRAVSVQSDIFSLGLILYEMFTGKRAFEGATLADLMRAQSDSTPPRLSALIGDVDPQAERMILKCLAHNPAARQRSALDVARAFPGGDPLAAALAAGETPSPEMVAASGGEGSLAAPKAWAMLGGTLLCIAAMVALAPWSTELGLAPLENSPEVMAHRAQELARKFGYKDAPADSGFWYERNVAFLSEWAKRSAGQAGDLKSAQQGHTRFYFRQSPLDMMPREIRRDATTPGLLLSRDLPPHAVSGMVMVVLEPDGMLDEFLAVPPQLASGGGGSEQPPADFQALFAESGLDARRFAPEPPVWISPVPFDASMGWKGSYAQDPATPIHVSAAAFQGRPVYFKVIAPWTEPERQASIAVSAGVKAAQVFFFGMIVTLLPLGVFLAWQNVAKGRGDWKGLARLTVFQVGMLLTAWLFLSHHQSSPGQEGLLIVLGLGTVLYLTLLSAGAYLAIEPHVRRRFPEMLTSWTRLVGGDWRDPLVGRHILIGVLGGAVFAVVRSVGDAFPVWLHTHQPPRQFFTSVLASLPDGIGILAGYAATRVGLSLALIFLLFLFRTWSKRRWVAEIATTLIFIPQLHRPGALSESVPFALVWAGAMTLMGSRAGLVALFAFDLTQAILQGFPLTIHPSDWYFSRTVMGLALCLSLAVYAFYTSLGGKPAFGGAVLSLADEQEVGVNR